MTVYIEYVIVDNFFVTMLISILAYRFISVRPVWWRIISASGIGTLVAVFYPLMDIHAALLILVKLALYVLLVFILFYRSASLYKGGLAFLMLTFLFGGVLFTLGLMIYADAKKALTLPLTNVPIGAIIALSLVLYAVLRRIGLKRRKRLDAEVYIVDVELDILGKTVKGKGFVDTGNRLYDPVSSLPVLVAGINPSLFIIGEENLPLALAGKGERLQKGAHYIKYRGAGTAKKDMLILKISELRLYSGETGHRIKDVAAGLLLAGFKDDADYDFILPPSALAGFNTKT